MCNGHAGCDIIIIMGDSKLFALFNCFVESAAFRKRLRIVLLSKMNVSIKAQFEFAESQTFKLIYQNTHAYTSDVVRPFKFASVFPPFLFERHFFVKIVVFAAGSNASKHFIIRSVANWPAINSDAGPNAAI